MFGEHNSVASRLKERIPHIYLCVAFVTVHICVHHMRVKNFHAQQKICFMMCTITSVIAQDDKLNFNILLKQTVKGLVGYPFIPVFLGLLNSGMR